MFIINRGQIKAILDLMDLNNVDEMAFHEQSFEKYEPKVTSPPALKVVDDEPKN